MKKFKKIVLNIITLVAVIVLYSASNKYPIVFKALIYLWAAWFLYTILDNILYRLGVKENEIRYPTTNDNYHRYSQIGIGIALIAISICNWLWISASKDFAPIGIGIGLILVLAGLLELPRGEMKLKSDRLKLSGIAEKFRKDALIEINIEEDKITLTNTCGKMLRQDLLRLDPKAAMEIELFLLVRIGNAEIIKNNVR